MGEDKSTEGQEPICPYVIDAYEVLVPSMNDLKTLVITEVVNVGDVDETVYGFTSQKAHMEWLEKRGELDEFLLEEATAARARKIAEERGPDECRRIMQEFQKREETILQERLHFHGHDFDTIRDPVKLNELVKSADPLKGPLGASAYYFQHAYFTGRFLYGVLGHWFPYLDFLDNQMSSIIFNWGKVKLWRDYTWSGPAIRFKPKRGLRRRFFKYIPRLGPLGWNDRVSSVAHYW